MQIITGELNSGQKDYPFSKLGNPDEIMAVDIETTGLSPDHAEIYLIGCAYRDSARWKRIQWIDDDGKGEADILTSFLLFARKYTILLTYNGDRFDLPFLARRIVFNGLQGMPGADQFPRGRTSVDLYQRIRPYQKVLSLPDLRQQTVEKFVHSERTEEMSGKDLIAVYREYIGDSGEKNDLRDQLLAHNAADVDGLIAVSGILALTDLFTADLTVYKAQANTHMDETGEPVQELIMYAKASDVPEDVWNHPFTVNRDGCFITITGNRAVIKVPIYNGRAYYFYANYKDYYYLPELDQAIHKSIAAFVDPGRREQATARTCYTAKVGTFLPEWTRQFEPFFKLSYDGKEILFEFTDAMKKDKQFFASYATCVYHHVLNEPD